jgi:hypothetical protein
MAGEQGRGTGRLGALIVLLLGLVLGSTRPATAGFCGSVGIAEGASKADVLLQCGDPTFVEERWVSETVYVYPDGRQGSHPVYVYRDGRQGSPPRDVPRDTASAPLPGQGRGSQSPSPRPAPRELVPPPLPPQGPMVPVLLTQPVVMTEWREEWTYNFGPHRLMLRLHFVNGMVSAIHTLNYGY